METINTTGYCLKCKERREMKEAAVSVSMNGARMAKGTCEVCGTKMCRTLGRTSAQ